MIKHFEEFRTDDDGTFYYYDDEKNENQWSYDLNELGKYIIKNEQEIERLNKIINEFDKFLFGELQIYGGGGIVQEHYDKLQELKDSDKE